MYPEKPLNIVLTTALVCFSWYSKKTWSRSASTTKKWPFLQGRGVRSTSLPGCTATPVASVDKQNAVAIASLCAASTIAPNVAPGFSV